MSEYADMAKISSDEKNRIADGFEVLSDAIASNIH